VPVRGRELVTVGRVVSVYGIKGWVKVVSLIEPKEAIFNFHPWHLASVSGDLEVAEIDDSKVHGAGLVVHIAGVDDRDIARQHCQKDILVDKLQLPELEDDAYYWHQLVGLKVYSTYANRRCLLGVVRQMVETGANDVMVVAPCEGSLDKRERLLPYLTGHYGIHVDLPTGQLAIDWDPEF
jgi:16S rRNA processing protein RimM